MGSLFRTSDFLPLSDFVALLAAGLFPRDALEAATARTHGPDLLLRDHALPAQILVELHDTCQRLERSGRSSPLLRDAGDGRPVSARDLARVLLDALADEDGDLPADFFDRIDRIEVHVGLVFRFLSKAHLETLRTLAQNHARALERAAADPFERLRARSLVQRTEARRGHADPSPRPARTCADAVREIAGDLLSNLEAGRYATAGDVYRDALGRLGDAYGRQTVERAVRRTLGARRGDWRRHLTGRPAPPRRDGAA